MAGQSAAVEYSSLGLIEWLIAREKELMKDHRNRAASVEDEKLKSLFMRLAEIHARSLTELQAYLSETKSQDEITRQINEIFL